MLTRLVTMSGHPAPAFAFHPQARRYRAAREGDDRAAGRPAPRTAVGAFAVLIALSATSACSGATASQERIAPRAPITIYPIVSGEPGVRILLGEGKVLGLTRE